MPQRRSTWAGVDPSASRVGHAVRPCGAAVPIAEFGELAEGEWQTLGVPLKCFRAAGADMTRISSPFRLMADGDAGLSIARVALGSLSDADAIADCPTG